MLATDHTPRFQSRRRRRKGPYTCGALLENALQIVALEGFQAATYARVAEATGVVRGVLYYNYAERPAFLRALHQHVARRRTDRLAAAWAAGAPRRRAAEGIERLWGLLNEPPFRAYAELERAAGSDPELRAILADDAPLWCEAAFQGVRSNPDDQALVELICHVFDGLSRRPPSPARAADEIRMLDMLKRMAVAIRHEQAAMAA